MPLLQSAVALPFRGSQRPPCASHDARGTSLHRQSKPHAARPRSRRSLPRNAGGRFFAHFVRLKMIVLKEKSAECAFHILNNR